MFGRLLISLRRCIQPVFANKGLVGAVYEITAAEDIITPDGTFRYAKGTAADTVTTDKKAMRKADRCISENTP